MRGRGIGLRRRRVEIAIASAAFFARPVYSLCTQDVVDINLKLAEEAMALQAKIGVGVVDASMFAEFASKFPGFFSEKFHLIMGPGKADNKECSFGDMMGVAKKVFDAIKNKSIS